MLSITPTNAALLITLAAAVMLPACGSGSDADSYAAPAQQLQEPMDDVMRSIDQVRGTRSSLDGLQSKLTLAVDQTNDVITVVLPQAADEVTASRLVNAARQQRAFLQAALATTRARNRGSIATAVAQMENSGRLANAAYGRLRTSEPELAALLPQAAAFNSGRLRDAARKVTPAKATVKQQSAPASSAPAPQASSGNGGVNGRASLSRSCDPNIEFDASTTSCDFAKNVFRSYAASIDYGSGYNTVIIADDPSGGEISMTCELDGGTITCFGASERLVEFPRWASDAY